MLDVNMLKIRCKSGYLWIFLSNCYIKILVCSDEHQCFLFRIISRTLDKYVYSDQKILLDNDILSVLIFDDKMPQIELIKLLLPYF